MRNLPRASRERSPSELRAVGITLDYAPVLDIHTNPKNPVIGDRALSEKAGGGGASRRRHHRRPCRAKASPRAASTFPVTATRRPIRTSSCRWSSIRSSGCRAVEFVPFKAAIAAGVATMMTAHVFMPALDEQRPATLSRRIVFNLLRDELQFEGVILSDDLEMKAIASSYSVPSAAVLAVEAGCDGVLICSGDHATQAAALEALVYAVESGRPCRSSRVDDALRRQQRAKERFLATRIAARPLHGPALRQRLGPDEHRAIADEMARFL